MRKLTVNVTLSGGGGADGSEQSAKRSISEPSLGESEGGDNSPLRVSHPQTYHHEADSRAVARNRGELE